MWIMILLASAILIIAIFFAVRYTFRKADNISHTHSQAMVFMNECQNRVLSMLSNVPDSDFIKPLTTLHEMIMYSDKSGNSELDWKIDPLLTRLEMSLANTEGEDVNALIDEAKLLFTRRSEEIRISKRGKF